MLQHPAVLQGSAVPRDGAGAFPTAAPPGALGSVGVRGSCRTGAASSAGSGGVPLLYAVLRKAQLVRGWPRAPSLPARKEVPCKRPCNCHVLVAGDCSSV